MKLSCVHVKVALLFILTLALTVIIFGQRAQLTRIPLETEFVEQSIRAKSYEVKEKLFLLHLREENVNVLKRNVEKTQKTLDELTANNQKLATENQECQQMQKDLTTALEQSQQEQTQLEADFVSLSAQWKEEINKLEEQLKAPSPVCAFVSTHADAKKLCS